MKIAFFREGFDDFTTEIYHIAKLFFENVELVNGSDEGADLTIRMVLAVDEGWVELKADMADGRGRRWANETRRKLEDGKTDSADLQIRRIVLSALLQLFTEAAGLEQPWGILTGVRPTKLMHNLLQNHSIDECMAILREQYLVSESKARLLVEIAERQLKVIPDLFHLDNEVSVYIGIPFCPTKCAYCTFPAYDIRGQNGSVEAFLEGLDYEIRETGRWLKEAGLKVTTLYLGGGTPTSIEAEQMDALFVTLHEAFPGMGAIRELTVEAGRPDTITEAKIEVMKKWNVGRISINPQSFTQKTLDTIGRHHTVTETVEKFRLAREMGLNNINMDLIIGLPDEGKAELRRSLEETEKLMPESLTVHTLSFKRASKMTQNREEYEVADRSEVTDMMGMALDWTERKGYKPYYMYRQKNILGNQENVGYALEGFESLYNILMMEERQTIIGLGCGAVSKVVYPRNGAANDEQPQKIERLPNPKEPSVYNSAYKDYVARKIKLLDEAYGIERVNHF